MYPGSCRVLHGRIQLSSLAWSTVAVPMEKSGQALYDSQNDTAIISVCGNQTLASQVSKCSFVGVSPAFLRELIVRSGLGFIRECTQGKHGKFRLAFAGLVLAVPVRLAFCHGLLGLRGA